MKKTHQMKYNSLKWIELFYFWGGNWKKQFNIDVFCLIITSLSLSQDYKADASK